MTKRPEPTTDCWVAFDSTGRAYGLSDCQFFTLKQASADFPTAARIERMTREAASAALKAGMIRPKETK